MAEHAAGPLVTILIPVFNGADYLAQAIDSALAQTWPHIEVVVVDDGSDDDGATAAICAGYGDRIRYVHKANGGVATALNLGLRVMRGEFLSWLSHDDLYTPDRIEVMLAAWRRRMEAPRERALLLCSDYTVFDAAGQELARARAPRSVGRLAAVEIVPHGCSMFLPRHLFDAAGGFHPGLPTTQDADMWLRLQRLADLEPVGQVTVHGRLHEAQGSRARWHMAEVVLNRLSMLDRVDSGFLDLGQLSRVERYRCFVDGNRFAGTPGVRVEAGRRLARAVESGTIALVWLGWRGVVSHEVLPLLWRNGYRVSLVRLPRLAPETLLEALAQLRCDHAWLWDAPLDPPARMLALLRELMAVLTADPSTAAALPPAGSVAGQTALRGLHGALLPVRALRRARPAAGGVWSAVAHEVLRQGGFRAVGHPLPAPPEARVEEGFAGREAVLSARRRGHRSAVGALTGLAVLAAARLRWRIAPACVALPTCLAHLVRRDAPPSWRPGVLPRLFARLSARPALAAAVARLVWRLSPGPEHARLRLSALSGVDGHFDPVWYGRVHPDVDAAGVDPLLHFLSVGLVEERDPSAGFDVRAYRADHPDVAARGIHPLLHYAVWGLDQGRSVRRSRHAAVPPPPAPAAFALLFPVGDAEALRVVRDLRLQLARRTTVLAWVGCASGWRPWVESGPLDAPPEAPEAVVGALHARYPGAGVLLVNPDAEGDRLVPLLAERGIGFDVAHTRPDAVGEGAWACAHRHFVFSTALQQALRQRCPVASVVLAPFPDASGIRRLRPWLRVRQPREFCRVAIFGELRVGEGLERVRAAVHAVRRWHLPFSFVLFGRVVGPSLPDHECLRVVAPPDDGGYPADALSAFNPHVAWVPERDPARALFAIAQAVEFGLPLVAGASEDARDWLAGRPWTRLASHRSPLAWLADLDALHRLDMPDRAWAPRRPLLGFDAARAQFAHLLLGAASPVALRRCAPLRDAHDVAHDTPG